MPEPSTSASLLPALAFATVFLFVFGLQQSLDRRAARLSSHLGRFTGAPKQVAASAESDGGVMRRKRRFSTIGAFDGFLKKQGFADRMDQQLAGAGLPLRVGEFLFIRWACALAAGGLANMYLNQPLAVIPTGVAGYFLPVAYLRLRKARRTALLNQQLADALGLISGGLRAGYSFMQGIEAVVRELPPPVGEEFKVVLEELRVGLPMEEALQGLVRRAPTEDVDMMVTAMLVQRSSGGNLAEVLDNIAHTIRERARIRREVNTLTAQERMSSYVVGALPVVAFAFLTVSNPGYLDLLFGTSLGQAMLAAAVALELIGFYVISRIVDIRL